MGFPWNKPSSESLGVPPWLWKPPWMVWVNYTHLKLVAIWGWFPLLTMFPVRSHCGRYNQVALKNGGLTCFNHEKQRINHMVGFRSHRGSRNHPSHYIDQFRIEAHDDLGNPHFRTPPIDVRQVGEHNPTILFGLCWAELAKNPL